MIQLSAGVLQTKITVHVHCVRNCAAVNNEPKTKGERK